MKTQGIEMISLNGKKTKFILNETLKVSWKDDCCCRCGYVVGFNGRNMIMKDFRDHDFRINLEDRALTITSYNMFTDKFKFDNIIFYAGDYCQIITEKDETLCTFFLGLDSDLLHVLCSNGNAILSIPLDKIKKMGLKEEE